MKKTGLLSNDGTPTERYAQFQTDSRRSEAALEALKSGWPEVFRKNRYAHRLDKSAVDDVFKEITGIQKTDPTFKAIVSTFNIFKEYAKSAAEASGGTDLPEAPQSRPVAEANASGQGGDRPLNLSTQINIVLPETTDITVYNAIFKSIQEHLL